MGSKQPTLYALHGSKASSVKDLAALFKKLTGREPTEQELMAAKKKLEKVSTSGRAEKIR